MVCFGRSNESNCIQGKGILDVMLKPFIVNKYGDERHARSLDPNHFLQGYSYVGPHSELKLRETQHDDIPLNDLDRLAKQHDYAYLNEKEAYQKDHDKQKHINNIWKADDEFIQQSRNSQDDPIVGNLASKLIQKKKEFEKSGILPTKTFSGFGEKEKNIDPVFRLRQIANEHYKKTDNKIIKRDRHQDGGFLPLIPIGIALASTLGSKVVGDLYDYFKKKIVGGNYKIPDHKNLNEKKQFLIDVIKNS